MHNADVQVNFNAPPSVIIETHGCKLNTADSQAIAAQFIKLGCTVVDDVKDADIYVLNTCTVTQQADMKARKALRAAGRANPDILLSATGCYVERQPKELFNLKTQAGIPVILGNTEKGTFARQVLDALPTKVSIRDLPLGIAIGSEALNKTRSMVKIQEGCDQVCAYCIVPKVRGREKSLPLKALLQTISQMSEQGVAEIVLTGTQLGTYGHEIPGVNLTTLLMEISRISTLKRLRVSSLQAHEITPDLLALWEDDRFCPHFHVPLQSGSDSILKAMRRRYTAGAFDKAIALIRKLFPFASITTDVIVGFPGETDSDFEATYRLCEELKLSKIHVFPYSIRPGTSAAYSPEQVEPRLIKSRSQKLRLLSNALERQVREHLIGSQRLVLWESMQIVGGERIWSGLTEDYIRAKTVSARELKGLVTPAEFVTTERVIIAD